MSKKKTHEEFLEELYLNNEGYRNGNFIVFGKFKGFKVNLLLRDKYGYCSVKPYDLLKGVTQSTSIKSALFKTSYLKEYLRQENIHFYNYYYRIVSEYTIGKNKITIIDKLGNTHQITPNSLFKGINPSIKSAEDKKEFIRRKIFVRNKYFRSGEIKLLDFFISNQKTIIVVEDVFGKYHMDVSVAYTGSKPTIEVAVDKNENLRKRLKQNGGDYDYSKSIYKDFRNKVKIICKKHGEFLQRAHNHIRGEGCSKCGKISMSEINSVNPTGWSYSNWIKAGERSKNFDSFKVYIVRLESKDRRETFYKIGKTFTSIEKRFNYICGYKVVDIVHIFQDNDGRVVTEKEAELLRINKEYRYIPNNTFGGYMECFSKVKF